MTGAPLPLEPSAEHFDAWTAACVAFVREHLLALDRAPSADVAGATELAARFREAPPESGQPLTELLARLEEAVAKTINTAGPGYLAYIPGGGIYASALADYLALSVNRYVGVARTAPALVEIEATTLGWLAALMGYPQRALGIFTSGGSLANFSAVVTAREAKLPENFLSGTAYASTETHLSVTKALRLAGFPAHHLRLLPVDSRRRLVPSALAQAIADDRRQGHRPFFVVANVGSTNTGAIDPIEDILAIAAEHDLWVHADAAYGGFFRLPPGGERRMPGLERCDSITLDPHKGLFLPYGTGCLLVRDGHALRRPHQLAADYLRDVAPDDHSVNYTDLSPELSRDFRGLRVWLPLKLHGIEAFRDALGEKLALARWAWQELVADPRFDVLDEPQLSIVAFRLRGRSDAANTELLSRVNRRGRVFLSSTVLDGRVTLRICVLSFRTHQDRVRDAVSALREEAAALGASL
jgi:aromatic-L-amino-acid decarboxylase